VSILFLSIFLLATLCDALEVTGLYDDLESDMWTVFAPTDDAFGLLGDDNIAYLYNDTSVLTELLLFHVVPGESLLAEDLPCVAGSNLVTMANGEDTRTLCQNGVPTYQKGTANPSDDSPTFMTTDIVTCNGVIHVIDKVLLDVPLPFEMGTTTEKEATGSPTTTTTTTEVDVTSPTDAPAPASTSNSTAGEEGECSTIADIACDSEDFDTLCTLLMEYNLTENLSEGTWTVFAPNEDAFAKATLPRADGTVKHILLFHVVPGKEVFADDLVCTETLKMANNKFSRTVCRGTTVYQKGNGNDRDGMPQIITSDIVVSFCCCCYCMSS
jgi:uncharacterized surface protein with fasciclin (FAS1) repeats